MWGETITFASKVSFESNYCLKNLSWYASGGNVISKNSPKIHEIFSAKEFFWSIMAISLFSHLLRGEAPAPSGPRPGWGRAGSGRRRRRGRRRTSRRPIPSHWAAKRKIICNWKLNYECFTFNYTIYLFMR